jgi:hypothetical protein
MVRMKESLMLSDWRGVPRPSSPPSFLALNINNLFQETGLMLGTNQSIISIFKIYRSHKQPTSTLLIPLYTSSQPQQCRGKVSPFRSSRMLMASLSADF